MISTIRTDSCNQHFVELVRLLDVDLAKRDGNDHSFYSQFNKIDEIKHVVVVYENDKPMGCGAIKEFSPIAMEVKRMYTLPECRGKGVASKVLVELEKWANEMYYEKCILETGANNWNAIELYKKNGYEMIPNYGPYIGIENSVCFEKEIQS